jgi:hypothetical protein
MTESARDIEKYQQEARDDLRVALLVRLLHDGRFEALAAPLYDHPGSTPHSICIGRTAVEAAQDAVAILRSPRYQLSASRTPS